MAKYTQVVTTNITVKLCTINRRSQAQPWGADVMVYGTFGAGTVAFFASPDGGTTLIAVPDQSGTAYTATANKLGNLQFNGFGGTVNGDNAGLYATVTGSTAATITIAIYDNQ